MIDLIDSILEGDCTPSIIIIIIIIIIIHYHHHNVCSAPQYLKSIVVHVLQSLVTLRVEYFCFCVTFEIVER